jgi:hypothetical protein
MAMSCVSCCCVQPCALSACDPAPTAYILVPTGLFAGKKLGTVAGVCSRPSSQMCQRALISRLVLDMAVCGRQASPIGSLRHVGTRTENHTFPWVALSGNCNTTSTECSLEPIFTALCTTYVQHLSNTHCSCHPVGTVYHWTCVSFYSLASCCYIAMLWGIGTQHWFQLDKRAWKRGEGETKRRGERHR